MKIARNLLAAAMALCMVFACGCDKEDSKTQTTILVQNYVGMNFNDFTDLESEGLFTDIEVEYEFSDEYEEGQIISQDPAAGKRVKEGQKVLKLIVCSGDNEEIALPAVSEGQDFDQVKASLTAKGFVAVTIETPSNTVAKGKVVRIDCNDKTPVKGSTVNIYVSTGPLQDNAGYIRSGEEISSADLEKLDAMFRQHIKEINFDSDKEVADEIQLQNVWVLYSETQTPCNRVYFIYQIKAHNTKESGYFYWYGGYDNVRSVNGELMYPDYYFEVKDKVTGLTFDGPADTGYWYYGISTPELLYQSEVGDMEYNGYELEMCGVGYDENGDIYCKWSPSSARP